MFWRKHPRSCDGFDVNANILSSDVIQRQTDELNNKIIFSIYIIIVTVFKLLEYALTV